MTEVVADNRKRIAFGRRLPIRADERFLVSMNDVTGEILLTPVSSVPTRELLVWESSRVLESVMTGLAESSQGLAAPSPEVDAVLDAVDPDAVDLDAVDPDAEVE
ncbi:MAG TPA: hypothetical protein VF635_15095 [Propionibacteriaceae bacterium]